MNALIAKNETQAKTEAIEISMANPGKYVTVIACFGLFAIVNKRLDIFAPTDGPFNWYVINGQVKQFTKSQIIADQNATPQMA